MAASPTEAGTAWPAEIFLFDVQGIDDVNPAHFARGESGCVGPFMTEDCALDWRDEHFYNSDRPLSGWDEIRLFGSTVRKASSIPSILRGDRLLAFQQDRGWLRI